MKTVKLITISFILVIIGMSKTSFAGNSDKTEMRNVGNFNGIKVSSGIDLYVTMGTTEEVKIIANNDIIDDIITEVKDGTLKIYIKQSNNWFNWNNSGSRKAYVTVKELVLLEASAGSDIKSENTLKGEELEVSTSSGSDVTIDVYYKNLKVDTSSGSDATVTGKVKTFEASSSSGSDLHAKDLESKICKVNSSSGSDATVSVTDELYAKASSGSDVYYYGNPTIKNIDESSGGDVKQK